jgi:hypothetical protein
VATRREAAALDTIDGRNATDFPADYDGMLGWPRPSWGDWETRDVYVVDVRRIPTMAPGYCYGKRVDYIDKRYYANMAEDIYDSNLKLRKIVWVGFTPGKLDNYGSSSEPVGLSRTTGTYRTSMPVM